MNGDADAENGNVYSAKVCTYISRLSKDDSEAADFWETLISNP